jgi:hypothetical protein
MRRSSIGRPRKLTDADVRRVLRWHARYLVWQSMRATIRTQAQLARELGVSPSAIRYVIRCGGRYKKPSA